jgi:hypothetical protein
MRLVILIGCAFVVAACKSQSGPRPDSDYRADVERICFAEQLSHAEEIDPNARFVHVAQWLGANLVTPQARDLLAQQARLEPADKAALLRAEAREVGIDRCPTADTWAPPAR